MLLFSAALLLLSLLCSVSLASAGDRLRELRQEKESLIRENCYLRAEYESRYSLYNVERSAEAQGLRPCEPYQIEYTELPGEG